MKANGRKLTRSEKNILTSIGYKACNWLACKHTTNYLEIVHKKLGCKEIIHLLKGRMIA